MSMTVRELFVKLGVKADNAELQRFDKGVSQVKTGMMGLVKVAGVVGGALTGAFLVARNIAAAGDEAEKTARNVGIASEELQKLQYAGRIAGVAQQELTVSLKTLNKSVYESSRGMSTYQSAFDSLGIKTTDATGRLKTADVVLGEMADSFAKIDDPAKKAALAQTLMGRSGYKMVTMLKDGKVGLEALKEEFAATGAMIDEDTRKSAEKFNDDLFRLKTAFNGVKIALGKDLLPMFIELFNKMRVGLMEFRKTWVETGRLQKAIKILTKAAALFLGIWTLSSVITTLTGISNVIVGLIGMYKKLGMVALWTQAKMLLLPIAILFFIGLMIELYNLLFTDKKTIFHYILEDLKTIVRYWKSQIENSTLGRFFGIGQKKTDLIGDQLLKKVGIGKEESEKLKGLKGVSQEEFDAARRSNQSKPLIDTILGLLGVSKAENIGDFGAAADVSTNYWRSGTTNKTINVGGIVINESNDPQKTTKAIENALGGLELQP